MAGEEHRLDSVVTSFIDPGYYADCSCGWKSEGCGSLAEAASAHREHERESAVSKGDG
jgi:hypothetical protein